MNPHDICAYTKIPDAFPAPDLIAPACENTFPTNNEPESLLNDRLSELKRKHTGAWGSKEWSTYRSEYYKLTAIADELIGRVFAALEENGYLENTIVLFTSDHGELMGGASAHDTVAYV